MFPGISERHDVCACQPCIDLDCTCHIETQIADAAGSVDGERAVLFAAQPEKDDAPFETQRAAGGRAGDGRTDRLPKDFRRRWGARYVASRTRERQEVAIRLGDRSGPAQAARIRRPGRRAMQHHRAAQRPQMEHHRAAAGRVRLRRSRRGNGIRHEPQARHARPYPCLARGTRLGGGPHQRPGGD